MADMSSGGTRLQEFLDGLPVEQNWIADHHIVWETGQQNGADGTGPESHTHCSALVAAIALDLDIYILRPPHHAQELLANAQVSWLEGSGHYLGPSALDAKWEDLGSSGDAGALDKAVAAANAGRLVIGGYFQPSGSMDKSGHIVVVRPQVEAISDLGPLVLMAGNRNYRSIHMANAFHSHAAAWPSAIRLFAHDTDLQTDFSPA